MAAVSLLKFPVSSPADTSPLELLNAKRVHCNPDSRRWNGCVNDFSRTLSAHVWEPLLQESAVTIFSGGTEGVISPHVTFITQESTNTGLVGAVGRTRTLELHEIGTAEHARVVAMTVQSMMTNAATAPKNVRLVLVKCPLLTSAKVAAIRLAGKRPVTDDTYESMAKSQYASAVGISVALGELDESKLEDAISSGKPWCEKASCSSGAELEDCHILLLSVSEEPGPFGAISGFMEDAIDASAVNTILEMVRKENGQVVQLFAKAEADPTGLVRGQRHTMNTDSDIHSTRHARAAVGGLLCGLTGDTLLYVSGGAEGQGPIGGGSLCLVYRIADGC